MSIAGRPAHLSVPKNSTGAKRKENSGRGDLTVSLIYLFLWLSGLSWWGCTAQEGTGQTRMRKWPYSSEEVLVWHLGYSLSQGISGKPLEMKTAIPEGCRREGS